MDFAMNSMLHRAMLREFDRVQEFFEAGDTPAARRHFQFLSEQLHVHHESEDEYLWPLVEGRTSDEKEMATMRAMEAEHAQLVGALQTCDADFAADLPADALAHLQDLRVLAAAHFAHEEAQAEPLLTKYLTKEDLEPFHKASREVPNSMLVFPWIADGGTAADQKVYDVLPGPVRLFVKPMMQCRYKAYFG